ncbi:beta-glucosidase domain protein [Rickettsia bellii str. RML An4]|uniref:Beta-glucosidase domain protein n=1 Tax=Rickettsia bellii str. RML An4 TaxID=1359193 RepID=A0A0F3Q990_RICBE|nr:beta-glucosidase domain protein [Rickettsia bellii str. RML An4]
MTLEKAVKPVIIGISDTKLTDREKALLHEHSPLGIALFVRNIKTDEKGKQNKEALAQLITDIKEILGENSIIAIDQEGGRVQNQLSIMHLLLKILVI